MHKIKYRIVYNRKKVLNKRGEALIQVEAYLDKCKVYFSTHIYITPEQWDSKKRRIKAHPQQEGLNGMIHEFILQLQWRELECWKKNIPITLAVLKSENCTPRASCQSFVSFGIQWVENSAKKDSTKNNLKTTLSLLQAFRSTLHFSDISYPFLLDFEHYLHERQYAVNTIAKHMAHLKTLVHEAVRQGYLTMKDSPFQKYHIKTVPTRHSFLLPKEMHTLETLVLPTRWKHLEHTLDAFLFCCYTGLRYSDFTQLTPLHFTRLDGNHWLIFRTIKTKEEIRLPLNLLFQGKALALLEKYKDKSHFFHLKPNPTVNKELIRLGKLAGLDKHISFHTARHTNATLLIYEGIQITTVQKLLGHRNIKTTQLYSNVFSEAIVKDLKKCRHKQEKQHGLLSGRKEENRKS